MDLGAYVQIDDLGSIAAENGIYVPRLRGYRLMADEVPTEVDVAVVLHAMELDVAKDMCYGVPLWSTHSDTSYFCSDRRDLVDRIILDDGNGGKRINWKALNRKRRKALKIEARNRLRRQMRQIKVFNKYCGRPDVLCIHARIGGWNWPCYKDAVLGQPWFLEKIDDSFDCTYCDIYARIKPRVKALTDEFKEYLRDEMKMEGCCE